MTKTSCKSCGAELPPHTERVEFKDPKTGALEYHPHAMALWLAGKDHGHTEDQIVQWEQSARASKKGLVCGYHVDTGRFGHEGNGEFCSIACAMKAAAERPRPKIRRLNLKRADSMTGPQMQAIRKKLGMTAEGFAVALGYAGEKASREVIVRRFECGMREIPPAVARVVLLLDREAK